MTYREYREFLFNQLYEVRLEPTAPGRPPKDVRYLKLNIGDEGTFYRSGRLPKSGRSINHATGTAEKGVSVYAVPWATSLAGLSERQWYTGKGVVVGFGSDNEPLIHPLGHWRKIGKPGYEPLKVMYEQEEEQRKCK